MFKVTEDNAKMRIGVPGLGMRIRSARWGVKLSQEKLAEQIGVSWMTIHGWERSERTPFLGKLADVARVCRVEIEWLFTYVPEEENPA